MHLFPRPDSQIQGKAFRSHGRQDRYMRGDHKDRIRQFERYRRTFVRTDEKNCNGCQIHADGKKRHAERTDETGRY